MSKDWKISYTKITRVDGERGLNFYSKWYFHVEIMIEVLTLTCLSVENTKISRL